MEISHSLVSQPQGWASPRRPNEVPWFFWGVLIAFPCALRTRKKNRPFISQMTGGKVSPPPFSTLRSLSDDNVKIVADPRAGRSGLAGTLSRRPQKKICVWTKRRSGRRLMNELGRDEWSRNGITLIWSRWKKHQLEYLWSDWQV